jgi:hypothetical protein
MSASVYPNITNERLWSDGADKVKVEAGQPIAQRWHNIARGSGWRAGCIVLRTWFSMDNSDSTGIDAEQERGKNEEVSNGDEHRGKQRMEIVASD